MRCYFNRARLYERGLAQEVTVIEKRKPRIATPDHPYVYSVECYYRDKGSGAQLARTHHYLRADGTIGGSGLVDPKELRLNGVHYRQHKGWSWSSTIRRDPSRLFRQPTADDPGAGPTGSTRGGGA